MDYLSQVIEIRPDLKRSSGDLQSPIFILLPAVADECKPDESGRRAANSGKYAH
jgi:hypothetical protein